MKITRALPVACLCLAIASPIAARERARSPLRHAEKKDVGAVANPIEPMEAREEKPRAGWNGFYSGLNAGAGLNDTESR